MIHKKRDEIQNEVVEELEYPVHGILDLAMRVGKTKIMISIIKKEKSEFILWVTTSAKLKKEDIPNEFKLWGEEYLGKTKIITYKTLHKEKGYYDKIVLDECQDITEANSITLLNKSLLYGSITCLTGTIPKHKEKLEIYSKLGLKILKSISIEDAIKLGLISNYKIYVIDTELDSVNKLEVKTKTKSFKTTELANYNYFTKQIEKANINNSIDYNFEGNKIVICNKVYELKEFTPKFECEKAYIILDKLESKGYIGLFGQDIKGKITIGDTYRIVNNDLIADIPLSLIMMRMQFIYNLQSKLQVAKKLLSNLQGRTIIFSGNINHAQMLSKYTYHSKTDKSNLEKFINKETNILSCVNSGGVGHTFENIDNIVIVQANSNKKGSISQKIARSLLLDGTTPNIFILRCKNTVDEVWSDLTLEYFNKDNIVYCKDVSDVLNKIKKDEKV